MSDWRNDPATERQKKRLEKETIEFRPDITKGEASDLIGNTVKAYDWEVKILRFFGVLAAHKLSHTEARQRIQEILEDPNNAAKWKGRPADKKQKAIYCYFGIPVPRALRHDDAEQFIDQLFKDEAKLEAWENHEDALCEEKEMLEGALEIFNDYCKECNCRRMRKALFRRVVDSLRADGLTLDQICDENPDTIFRKALEFEPSLQRTIADDFR